MKKIFGIILLFSLSEAVAQWDEAALTKKFSEYAAVWQKKKLHLIFNQDKFSPGDTVYFKAYFLSEDLVGVPGNQLIDLHLVNASGNSVLHIKFGIPNGVGKNQFVIPPSLPQGFYIVTAYSSWMLNFDPALFFKKKISVVERSVLVEKQNQELIAAVEGGRLVRGLKNKVVIRAEANAVVQVVDASGANMGHTLTDSAGLGTINFYPRENNSYFAQRVGTDNKLPLPAVQMEGLIVTASKRADGVTNFSFAITNNLKGKEFMAVVTSRDNVAYSHHLSITTSGSEFSIPQTSLPEGIAHLSVLDASGQLFASRDFYNAGINHGGVSINVEKKSFHAREKVKLDISVTDEKGKPIEGEFSVKAISSDLLQPQNQNSFAEELFVQSYLRERYVINRTDSSWFSKLDERLILNTEDIPWKEILSNKFPKPSHSLSNFIQMKGRVTLVDTTARKLPDYLDIIFYLQRSNIRYQTTVEKGRVWLAVPQLYGEDELFYLAETFYYKYDQQHGEEFPGLKINWENQVPKFQPAPSATPSDQLDAYASFASKSKLINQSYQFYLAKANPQPKNEIENEIVSPDLNINVQEYTLFPTMTDLIKEIIPYLQHRKIGHRDRVLAVLDEDLATLSTGDPLYIIDGIATKNTYFFLSLKPADLLNVKLVINSQKLKGFGLMGKNGIVFVKTKRGDAREPIDPSRLIQGVNRAVDFKTHTYSALNSSHLPDFRSTVLWSPSVKTSNGKAQIEFFTSDTLGGLSIRVEGLTTQGVPFSKEIQLSVENKLRE